jgi:hypothetical protein
MIDSSVLARQCAPESPDVTPSVRISDLWKQTFEAIERSPAREALIDRWARDRYREQASWRERHGLASCVHEMLTTALRQGDFVLRVHDGATAWRLPLTAFAGWRDDIDLEMTWTTGRLWHFEASDKFRAIADLELPLLITQEEAGCFRAKVAKHVQEVERLPPEEPPQVSDGDVEGWCAEWREKRFWPVREAMLWVASRDLTEVARLHLGSVWDRCEDLGIAGAIRAKCEIEGQQQWRRIHTLGVEPRLIDALASGAVRAHGLFEGQSPMRVIDPVQWTRLVFDVPPERQRDRSDAFKSAARLQGQTHGANWSAYWTAIAIERDDLVRRFPAIPLPVQPSGDAAVRASDWSAEFVRRARWSTPYVIAWIALRDADRVAARFGPSSNWEGLLEDRSEERLDLLLLAIENELEAHDRFPRFALERAVQREGLLAADVAAGQHATHRLEQLLRHEFWRDDVLARFPQISPASQTAEPDDSDAAVDATIRRLSEERGSPLPRNEGAKIVKPLHNSRSLNSIRQRIEIVFPDAKPGPRGPRKRVI